MMERLKYDDILYLPHPVSERHPRMPLSDRAAQFAPFAALTGYDAAIRETARETQERVELDEDEKELLDRQLRLLLEKLSASPWAVFTYFRPDEKKDGGSYVTAAGRVKKYDPQTRRIFLEDGTVFLADDLARIGISGWEGSGQNLSGCS